MSVRDSVSRYDLSLAAIAVPLLVASIVGVFSSVGLAVALGAGCVPATVSMGYALFYRPPVEKTA